MFEYLNDEQVLYSLYKLNCRHPREWVQAHWDMYHSMDAIRTAVALGSDINSDYPVVLTRVGTPDGPSHDIIEWCEKEQINIKNFNHSIHILVGVKNCTHMINGCTDFNKEVDIPQTVIDCVGMLRNCTSFNQSLTLPSNLNSCSYMLYNCKNFNKQLVIPKSVKAAVCMIAGCDSLGNIPVCEDSNFDVSSLVMKPTVLYR